MKDRNSSLLITLHTSVSRWLSPLDRVIRYILAVGISVIMFAVVFHVFGRYFFGKTYMGTMELVRYSMIWVSMLGAAVAFGTTEHPCIDFLKYNLSEKAWFLLHLAGNIALCVFLIVMIIGGFQIAIRNWHQTSLGLQIPMFFPYLAIPTGAIIMLPYIFVRALADAIKLFARKENNA